MARVKIVKPETIEDPAVAGIFEWVTAMEGSVPNHFYVELNFPEFFTAKLGATKVLWEAGELDMAEIQHVGILVSRDNGCAYCTAAFCTILNHGLGTAEDYVAELVNSGVAAVADPRLQTILDYALKVNSDAAGITDSDVNGLRKVGLKMEPPEDPDVPIDQIRCPECNAVINQKPGEEISRCDWCGHEFQ